MNKSLLAAAMIGCMALSSGSAIAPPAPPVTDVSEQLAVQEAAHDMAEAARRLGLPEDHDMECCGSLDGITASGTHAEVGRTVACNTLPFGTVVWIDGIGERVVEDRGGMRGNVIDVLCHDHAECAAITQRGVDVWEVVG